MIRKARIDTRWALHYIIVRGIIRKKVFQDNADREFFVDRFDLIPSETKTQCFACALIPNYIHLLLKTGATPISTVMKRLLIAYAMHCNKQHKRYGHLFQNRYKSILCRENTYLLERVRYIQLSPLRAKLSEDLKGLDRDPYSGLSALMGKSTVSWQDKSYIFGLFHDKVSLARRRYRNFVTTEGERIAQG